MTKNNKKRKTTILSSNLPWGVYMIELPDGRLFTDGDGNIFSMNGEKGDLAAIEKMRTHAAGYGVFDGKVVFAEGRWKISNSEYEAQIEAMLDEKDPESIFYDRD